MCLHTLVYKYVYLCQSLSRVQFFAAPWAIALPDSSVLAILQARTLEWVAIPFSRGLLGGDTSL